MFVDKVHVNVSAGDGGDGLVSFRHEIYIAKGGPDGGDGGDGGSVVLEANTNQDTLAAFRYKKLINADNGRNGGSSNKHGKSASALIVPVPVGTVVLDEMNRIIADLSTDQQTVVVAKGGKGGFGNAHFKSSIRQAPRVSEKGEKGEAFNLILELRMLADVGLIGLPNAGKSSFIRAVSNAKPAVADYPFTTLTPHIGVSDIEGQAILLADIPGLIKGASRGKGLGDEFLRHVSRCSVLLHLIDVNSPDIVGDYQTIRTELAAYSQSLLKKSEIVAITKVETLSPTAVKKQADKLKRILPLNTQLFSLSSYAKKGLTPVMLALKQAVTKQKLSQARQQRRHPVLPVIQLKESVTDWQITKQKDVFCVTGQKIEHFAKRTDFNNEFGLQRLRDIMKKMGISQQLRRDGINNGDQIVIGKPTIGKLFY